MTAVEQLVEEVEVISNSTGISRIEKIELYNKAIERAKEMEKEQKKFIFECGRNFQLTGEGTFEEVYKETFKSE